MSKPTGYMTWPLEKFLALKDKTPNSFAEPIFARAVVLVPANEIHDPTGFRMVTLACFGLSEETPVAVLEARSDLLWITCANAMGPVPGRAWFDCLPGSGLMRTFAPERSDRLVIGPRLSTVVEVQVQRIGEPKTDATQAQ